GNFCCELGSGICPAVENAPKARAPAISTHTHTLGKADRGEAQTALMAGRVIHSLRVKLERGKSLWRAQVDLDFSPARIMCFIAWPISQNILIPQLHADLGRDVWQIIQIFHREYAAPRHFRHFAQQGWAIELFRCPVAISERVENADGVKLR